MSPPRTAALLLAIAPAFVFAGSIKGIAVENLTGFPLGRARITLNRLEGNTMRAVTSVITGRDGQFQFLSLANGYYQVMAKRPGFAEARAGQTYKGGAGTPILIEAETNAVAELRVRRLGVVTGRTLDENRVGLPRIPVSTYTVTVPRQIVASAVSDDLGVYRITGLPAGRYLVRTGAAQLDQNDSVLPTYHPFSSVSTRDARPVFVELDAEVPDIDLAPISGSTAAIAVRVTGCLGMAQITLSSDHGRKQMPVQCIVDTVRFTGLAPGEYEVLAEGEANQQKLAGFTVTQAYGGQRVLTLELTPLPTVHIRMIGGGLAATDAGLLLRRRDAAGDGAIVPLSVNPIQVPPGYWQLAGRPPGGSNAYVASVSFDARGGRRTRPDPDPDWFEFYLDGAVQAYVALSFSPGRVTGRVKGGKEAIGAPVYLVPVSSLTRQRMNGSHTVYAAQDGTYRFEGLAPGSYLVLASLETTEATEEALSGRAQPVTVEEGATVTLDLSLQ